MAQHRTPGSKISAVSSTIGPISCSQDKTPQQTLFTSLSRVSAAPTSTVLVPRSPSQNQSLSHGQDKLVRTSQPQVEARKGFTHETDSPVEDSLKQYYNQSPVFVPPASSGLPLSTSAPVTPNADGDITQHSSDYSDQRQNMPPKPALKGGVEPNTSHSNSGTKRPADESTPLSRATAAAPATTSALQALKQKRVAKAADRSLEYQDHPNTTSGDVTIGSRSRPSNHTVAALKKPSSTSATKTAPIASGPKSVQPPKPVASKQPITAKQKSTKSAPAPTSVQPKKCSHQSLPDSTKVAKLSANKNAETQWDVPVSPGKPRATSDKSSKSATKSSATTSKKAKRGSVQRQSRHADSLDEDEVDDPEYNGKSTKLVNTGRRTTRASAKHADMVELGLTGETKSQRQQPDSLDRNAQQSGKAALERKSRLVDESQREPVTVDSAPPGEPSPGSETRVSPQALQAESIEQFEQRTTGLHDVAPHEQRINSQEDDVPSAPSTPDDCAELAGEDHARGDHAEADVPNELPLDADMTNNLDRPDNSEKFDNKLAEEAESPTHSAARLPAGQGQSIEISDADSDDDLSRPHSVEVDVGDDGVSVTGSRQSDHANHATDDSIRPAFNNTQQRQEYIPTEDDIRVDDRKEHINKVKIVGWGKDGPLNQGILPGKTVTKSAHGSAFGAAHGEVHSAMQVSKISTLHTAHEALEDILSSSTKRSRRGEQIAKLHSHNDGDEIGVPQHLRYETAETYSPRGESRAKPVPQSGFATSHQSGDVAKQKNNKRKFRALDDQVDEGMVSLATAAADDEVGPGGHSKQKPAISVSQPVFPLITKATNTRKSPGLGTSLFAQPPRPRRSDQATRSVVVEKVKPTKRIPLAVNSTNGMLLEQIKYVVEQARSNEIEVRKPGDKSSLDNRLRKRMKVDGQNAYQKQSCSRREDVMLSRMSSQHQVTDDGSPVPSEQVLSYSQQQHGAEEMDQEMNEAPDPAAYFGDLGASSDQDSTSDEDEEILVPSHDSLTVQNAADVSQAVTHSGFEDYSDDVVTQRDPLAEDDPFNIPSKSTTTMPMTQAIRKEQPAQQCKNKPAADGRPRERYTSIPQQASEPDVASRDYYEDPEKTLVEEEETYEEDESMQDIEERISDMASGRGSSPVRSSDMERSSEPADEVPEFVSNDPALLEPHRRPLYQTIFRIGHGLVRRVVDIELAIENAVEDYYRDQLLLIEEMEQAHRKEVDQLILKAAEKDRKLSEGFKLMKQQLEADMREKNKNRRMDGRSMEDGETALARLDDLLKEYP